MKPLFSEPLLILFVTIPVIYMLSFLPQSWILGTFLLFAWGLLKGFHQIIQKNNRYYTPPQDSRKIQKKTAVTSRQSFGLQKRKP